MAARPTASPYEKGCRTFAVVGLMASAAAVAAQRLTDFDLPWHLTFGRVVVERRAVPTVDDLAFTHMPIRYADFASDVVLHLVERAGGLPGLQGLAAVVTAALLASLLHRARDDSFVGILTVTLATFALGPWLFLRPTLFALLLSSVAVLAIERHERSADQGGRLALASVAPLTALWANMHQSAVLAVALMGGYAASRTAAWVAPPRLARFLPTRTEADAPFAAGAAALTVLATMTTRAGPNYLLQPFTVRSMESFVTEWIKSSPHFLFVFEPWTGFFVAGAAAVVLVGRGGRADSAPRRGFDLALLAVALLLARYVRLLPFVTVLLAPRASYYLSAFARPSRVPWILIAAFAWAPAPRFLWNTRSKLGVGFWPRHFPVDATAFIERHPLQGNMWNFSPYGGYLAYRLYPRYRVFIDGRVPWVHPLELAIEQAHGETDNAAFASLDGRFHFEWAVCRATEGETYCGPIATSREWAMVYWDESTALYVRRGGPNDPLAREGYLGLRHLMPLELILRAGIRGETRLSKDGALAAQQAPSSPRAIFVEACGALAARDEPRFRKDVATLRHLSPETPAANALESAWVEATGHGP